MTPAAVLQQVLVMAAILAAGLYVFQHLAPRSAGRARMAIGTRLEKASGPGWLRRYAHQWARQPIPLNCDHCAACSGCAVRDARQQRPSPASMHGARQLQMLDCAVPDGEQRGPDAAECVHGPAPQ